MNGEIIVGIISLLVTGPISIVAIRISVKTLKANNEMIEESTRPYIVIYVTVTNYLQPKRRILIKNFGKSAGVINNLEYLPEEVKFTKEYPKKRPFDNIIGSTFAPGQSLIIPIDGKEMIESGIEAVVFNISYTSNNGKTYNEYHPVIISSFDETPSDKAGNEGSNLKVISYTLQEIGDKMI